eukprot:CAMPEP_0172838498 /NCGR_PEP_ID=MMETSP1075-20121228/27921_2 /TAXON_ID=2916 /ORGANISM="Ceratium fusus, Strain PA161109" /LENGTH=57 /DNA_ID=CAMNT_0013682019 /DNA_START=1 /DNA_END=171 /DNA_ORIENTATION=-
MNSLKMVIRSTLQQRLVLSASELEIGLDVAGCLETLNELLAQLFVLRKAPCGLSGNY